ncbi:hypothetical protein ACEPAF_8962 [Sanghuangporus sanghuang]
MASLIAPTQGASSSSSLSSHSNLRDTVRVPLTPSAGFCIKSLTTEPGFYTYVDAPPPPPSPSSSKKQTPQTRSNLLEPEFKVSTRTLQIQVGTKVFLNIAWDRRVPAPPEASEEVVRRAMAGADLDDEERYGLAGYYVPVVVSEPREDLDKSGKPSIVFDCVFSSALRSRCLKDKEFKLYLIELALEHVEEKAHMTLSRQVGTPNITSKGKLEPRTVLMPRSLADPGSGSESIVSSRAKSGARLSPLVQEIPNNSGSSGDKESKEGRTNGSTDKTNASSSKAASSTNQKPLKSILKPSSTSSSFAANAGSAAGVDQHVGLDAPVSRSGGVVYGSGSTTSAGVDGRQKKPLVEEIRSVDSNHSVSADTGPGSDVNVLSALPPLRWSWSKEGEKLRVEIDVPEMTRELHAQSTLDIEPRRILLHIPQKHFLDVNLDLSDAQIGKMGEVPAESLEDGAEDTVLAEAIQVDALRVRGHNAGQALRLKRQRDFDVENARAEWRVEEKKLVISV